MKKRFYVGAKHIALGDDNHLHVTEQDAINEAINECKLTGNRQIVVKIVAVIEKDNPPVKVTRIK